MWNYSWNIKIIFLPKSLWNSGAHYTCMHIILDKIWYTLSIWLTQYLWKNHTQNVSEINSRCKCHKTFFFDNDATICPFANLQINCNSYSHRDKTRVQMPAKMSPHLKLLCWLFMGPTLGFDTKLRKSFLIKFGVFYNKKQYSDIIIHT